MNLPILNRQFEHPADGWYQIEVPGEHLNAGSGVMQIIDCAAVDSIVNRFNQEADAYEPQHGTPFPGMLVDHEHFKHDPDKETIAYGWLMRMENRDGKPFGQIRWTNTGKPAIDGGDYRFFSSEYAPQDLQVLNHGKKPLRVRPLRLDGLTLTNDPNNKGGAAITNRSPRPAAKKFPDNTKLNMTNIATKLGINAEAGEDAILAEITRLLNRADISSADLTTLKQRTTALEAENQTLLGEQVDGVLAEHRITDPKLLNRLRPILAPLPDRAERVACLAELGLAVTKDKDRPMRVLNRGTAPNAAIAAAANTDDAQTLTRKIQNRASELQAGGMKFDPAWKQAQREVLNVR
jgi:hypothetical protein